MTAIWRGFLLLLARATESELARMLEFLKTENQVLRAKLPRRVEVTAAEKRLLIKLGKPLGTKLRELISIVTPRTFARWVAAEDNGASPEERPSRGGRPKTSVDVRALIVRFATENGWGFGRILGELKKLGIAISKSTVKAILLENGFDLGPKRGQGSWAEFVERHAKTLWACDFFQKKIWTTAGLIDHFALFFIHVGTRRVYLAGISANPTHAWVAQQARNMAMIFQDESDKPTHLIRDNDKKFPVQFDTVFKAEDVDIVRTCVQAPNMNAFIERWIQSLQVECIDHFVVFGEDHLRYLIESYLAHYNGQRPHQSLENLPLDGHILEPPPDWNPEQVVCTESLGGVLKSYSWQVAA